MQSMRPIRYKGSERLCDAISFRVSPEQRAFLEQTAEENNVGLCEAGRIIIDMVRNKEGVKGC
jgi:hypothetical protein